MLILGIILAFAVPLIFGYFDNSRKEKYWTKQAATRNERSMIYADFWEQVPIK